MSSLVSMIRTVASLLVALMLPAFGQDSRIPPEPLPAPPRDVPMPLPKPPGAIRPGPVPLAKRDSTRVWNVSTTGASLGDYQLLGDDPAPSTPISFEAEQALACSAAGVRLFDYKGLTNVTVDLTLGDLPLISFIGDGRPYAFLLPAASVRCAVTGARKAKAGTVSTVVQGGAQTMAGDKSYDQPQWVSCYSNGARTFQGVIYDVVMKWTPETVGMEYSVGDGRRLTYSYDARTAACLLETRGSELIPSGK